MRTEVASTVSGDSSSAASEGPAASPPSAEDWQFKLLYDSHCPFCRWEVRWLTARDRHGGLAIEDITDATFDPARYGISTDDVHARLHGVDPDGTVVVGMEAVRRAYRAAGVGWAMAWTSWPVLRWFADLGYVVFARWRVPLGRWVGRKCAC